MTGSHCQDVCKNVNGAKYFSHYNEGREAEHGVCGCFSSCSWPTSDGCSQTCASRETHDEASGEDLLIGESNEVDLDSSETFGGEVDVEIAKEPRPGPHYCHCMHGPLHPDVDSCDLWP